MPTLILSGYLPWHINAAGALDPGASLGGQHTQVSRKPAPLRGVHDRKKIGFVEGRGKACSSGMPLPQGAPASGKIQRGPAPCATPDGGIWAPLAVPAGAGLEDILQPLEVLGFFLQAVVSRKTKGHIHTGVHLL